MTKKSGHDFPFADTKALRAEIEWQGIVPDNFLSADPDVPVFGLNLACAYPFPANIAPAYESLAKKLSATDPSAYLYPLWETHVTIATFVNFARHERPDAAALKEFEALTFEIISLLTPLFAKKSADAIAPFDLQFGQPLLTRKAAILPLANPSGEISRIRNYIREAVCDDLMLREKLTVLGLNIPEIIHSTILRFRAAPNNLPKFLTGFDAAAAEANLGVARIPEICLTAETRPYMREGKILHRFPL